MTTAFFIWMDCHRAHREHREVVTPLWSLCALWPIVFIHLKTDINQTTKHWYRRSNYEETYHSCGRPGFGFEFFSYTLKSVIQIDSFFSNGLWPTGSRFSLPPARLR